MNAEQKKCVATQLKTVLSTDSISQWIAVNIVGQRTMAMEMEMEMETCGKLLFVYAQSLKLRVLFVYSVVWLAFFTWKSREYHH